MGVMAIPATSVGPLTAERPAAARVLAPASVTIVVVALVAVTVVLHLRTGDTVVTSWWLSDVVLASLLLVPGAVILAHAPSSLIGWLQCGAAVGCILCAAGREYLVHGFLVGHAPGWQAVGWFCDAVYVVSMGLLLTILFVFPDPATATRAARRLTLLPAAAMSLAIVGQLFSRDASVEVRGRELRNPLSDVLAPGVTRALMLLALALLAAGVVAAIVVLVRRYRRSGQVVRQQMKWIVWAGSIAAVELLSEVLPWNAVATVTAPLAAFLVSASVSVAILRYRLLDIDLVISRTLVYGTLSGAVVLFYLGAVTLGSSLFGATDHPGRLAVATGLTTAVVALLLHPVRSRLQHGVDRLVYGYRRDPYGAMRTLGRSVAQADHDDLPALIAETITRALRVPYLAILGSDRRVLAQRGAGALAVERWTLTYHGSPRGELVVGLPRGQERFSRAERELITDLARQVAAVVHAVSLTAELQRSRHRLVNAKEEERRRLRRDLHDGLGARLAGLSIKLEAAGAMGEDRTTERDGLVRSVQHELRAAVGDVRVLVSGLRPPALDERGLVGAVRDRARSLESAPDAPRIGVVAGRLPVLPAAVEVAAYWIACEAVTNVVRHADACSCEVRVGCERDGHRYRLTLEVEDDGTGPDDDARPGVGTASMTERAEEIGGTFTISPGPAGRGTTIRTELPWEGESG